MLVCSESSDEYSPQAADEPRGVVPGVDWAAVLATVVNELHAVSLLSARALICMRSDERVGGRVCRSRCLPEHV